MPQHTPDILSALGGKANVQQVAACSTRLRVLLNDNNLLNKNALLEVGAIDVIQVGETFQIIFGRKAALYRDALIQLLNATQQN